MMAHKTEHPGSTLIFLAEDDDDDIFLFEEALSDTGIDYRLQIAKDGYQLIKALTLLSPSKSVIVFLDVNMPLKNGFETLTDIRKTFAYQFPVFLLSTSTSTSAVDISRKLGATGYLSKQGSLSRLSSIMHDVLSKDWTNRSLEKDFYIRLEYDYSL